MKRTVAIRGEWIKLDSLLKLAEIVETGGVAKMVIQDGAVSVNDQMATGRSKKIYPGDKVKVDADPEPVIIEVEKE